MAKPATTTAPIVPHDFKERQTYYEDRELWPYHWQREYHLIIAPLYLMLHHPHNIKSVVELGCADGGLAVQALHDLPAQVQWWGFDIIPRHIKNSQRHPRYLPRLLDKQLWETELPKFHVFVCIHTYEHLYPDEAEQLVEWLGRKCSRAAIMSVPSPHNRYGQHVLGKPKEWIIKLFGKHGFTLRWQCGGWFGWFTR